MKPLLLSLTLLLAISPLRLSAQEVISSGGTHVTGTGFSLSWTIGETVIGTLSGGSCILTQGFHQTRLSASAVDVIPLCGISLAVYPNPSVYVLHLWVEEGDFSQLKYSLLTLDGKTLLAKNITSSMNDIDMKPYSCGTYLLRVLWKTGKQAKTYRVVKTN